MFLLCDILVRVVIAVGIPLLPPIVVLSLVPLLCIAELGLASRLKFSRSFGKAMRITYSLIMLLIHMSLALNHLLTGKGAERVLEVIGYVAVGLICLNILREIVQIVVEVVWSAVELYRACFPRRLETSMKA